MRTDKNFSEIEEKYLKHDQRKKKKMKVVGSSARTLKRIIVKKAKTRYNE